jgi:hypothetical protein
MDKPKLISRQQLSRLLNTDPRSKLVMSAEPFAFMLQGGQELPLYRAEIVQEIKATKEAK